MFFRAILDKAADVRERDLMSKLSAFLSGEKRILDVGCGSGKLSKRISEEFGLRIHGIDLKEPEEKLIPFKLFDGKKVPFKDNCFDSVFLFDVLHHIKRGENRRLLLSECLRVSKNSVIIKDHYYSNFFQLQWLKLMDFFGNISSTVCIPFNFISKKQWESIPCHKSEYWVSRSIPNVMMAIENHEQEQLQ